MIDNPDRAERLLAKLDAALPVPARMTPELAATLQAPDRTLSCTITCIRNAPTESQTALVENAQSGSTNSDSTAARMMVRRRPKRSDKVPKQMPPMMAPIL